MRRFNMISIFIILIIADTGCRKSTLPGVIPPMPKPAFTDAVPNTNLPSPGQQVVYIVDKMNSGKDKDAETLVLYTLDMEAEDILDKQPGDWAAKDKTAFWKDLTKNKTVVKTEILNEKITQDFAIVWFRVTYKDGTFKELETEMHFNDGKWLMIINQMMLK